MKNLKCPEGHIVHFNDDYSYARWVVYEFENGERKEEYEIDEIPVYHCSICNKPYWDYQCTEEKESE
jgi:hypothetical protein